MASIAKRAENADINIEIVTKNALKIVEAYAGSGFNGHPDLLPYLYHKMIVAQIEVFEDDNQEK